ncbi:MAG: hypothetical protein AAF371_19880 [Pseudomonadota bacterium]
MPLGLRPEGEELAAKVDKICWRVLMGLPLLATAGWLIFRAFAFFDAMHPVLAWSTAIGALLGALVIGLLGTWVIIAAIAALDPTESGTWKSEIIGAAFALAFVFTLMGLFFAQAKDEAATLQALASTMELED